jgi:hypothetical protein
MIEKFFFTRAVSERDYGFSRETREVNNTAFYRIPGAFWSIRRYGNVDACLEIADDLSEGSNAHLLIRAPDGPHIEELHNPRNELSISVAANEDLYGVPFFREGHHEKSRMPETDDRTRAL